MCSVNKQTGVHFCPCKSRDSANIIYLVLNGEEYPLYPEFLFTTPDASGLCTLEAQPTMNNMPWVLGDTFMRTIVPIFDVEKIRIGVAVRKDYSVPDAKTAEKQRRDQSSPRA